MTRPAFQFYPADWRKDNALRACSIGARGLWMELCAVMHECVPYGHLTTKNGEAMPNDSAAQLCGVELKVYRKLLAELEAKGVPSRTKDGTLYSRRMVRDEKLRMTRADAGSKGGNPNLLNQKVNQQDNQGGNQNGGPKDNQIPTPSASTASSKALQHHALERTPTIIPRAGDSHGTNEKTPHVNGKTVEKWGTKAWVTASAITFAMTQRDGEEYLAFADRVKHEANSRRVKAKAEARRHT